MKIKEISWFDRPWTRLKNKGVSNLSDAELLAVVLGRGNFQENAVNLSHRVLSKYNFHKLADLSLPELEKEFKNDIQASPPLKDSGNDLIVIKGETFKAIQVKTTTSDRFVITNIKDKLFHILALVQLIGNDRNIYLDNSKIFLLLKEEIDKTTYNITELKSFELERRINKFFS